MHEALCLLDTLSHIFSQVENNGSLQSCMVVCHAWFNPAVETLWSRANTQNLMSAFSAAGLLRTHYPGIHPVFRISSSSSSHRSIVDKFVSLTKQGGLAGAPKQEVLDRLYHYSRYIRSLDFNNTGLSLAECASILPSHKKPLFPLARKFRVTPRGGDDGVDSCKLLMHAPRTVRLVIDMKKLDDTERAGGLLKLFWLDLRLPLQNLTELEYFTIRTKRGVCLHPDIFRILGCLPKLKGIAGSFSGVESGLCQVDAFLRLKRMNWKGELAPSLLAGRWFPPPNLRCISSFRSSADGLHGVIGLLSTRESFVVILQGKILDNFRSLRIRAISGLRRLQQLRLVFQNPIMLEDDDIEFLAIGLPRLKALFLEEPRHDGPATLSHRAIEHLVGRCPDLEDLLLTFDTSQIPSVTHNQWTNLNKFKAGLPKLKIRPLGSKVGSPMNVAAWIMGCCGTSRQPVIETQPYTTVLWIEVGCLLEGPTTMTT